MKSILKNIITLILLSGLHVAGIAQTASETNKLQLGKVEPYRMEVTYNKTSHLLFPSAIRYVDLGSDWLVAGKAEDAANVLRVKAAVRDFCEETNFSVITEDGRFYSFNVLYNPAPVTLNYNLLLMQQCANRTGNEALFEELGSNRPSLTGLLMESIYKKDKRVVKNIGSHSYGIHFFLKGIYIHNGLFYFHTALRNNSNLSFKVDLITFKIVDRKLAKRTVVQEKPLVPLRVYKPLENIEGNAAEQNVFLLDQFTIGDDKLLVIELFEKNGGRQQVLKITNEDLVKARLVKDMELKIK